MKTLVYSGPAASAHIVKKFLSDKFDVRVVDATVDSLYPEFEKCAIFLDASMKVPITADMIRCASGLELVITATTGFSHIDHHALEARGIPLLTLRDQKEKLKDITAAAEHSWLLLMACARRLRAAIKHVDNGNWNRVEFPGIMLRGKTLGVIGVGRIGSWMARYATAFGMTVIGFDPCLETYPEGVEHKELDELFRFSDFVSLHVSLTDENKGMITRELLMNIKPDGIFINTSRSELVNEEALVEGLYEGRISAVGVDVLKGEPEITTHSPLWKYAKTHDNVIITPHIGGFCLEAVDIVVELSCRRILDFFCKNL